MTRPAPEGRIKNAKKVFVVHGRNVGARDAMFGFLRAIGLEPIEWSSAISATGSASPYIGQALDAAFELAQAVVVLLTPDDVAYLRPEYANGDDDPGTGSDSTSQTERPFRGGHGYREASRANRPCGAWFAAAIQRCGRQARSAAG